MNYRVSPEHQRQPVLRGSRTVQEQTFCGAGAGRGRAGEELGYLKLERALGEKRRKARRVGDGGHPWSSYLRNAFKSHISSACCNQEVVES